MASVEEWGKVYDMATFVGVVIEILFGMAVGLLLATTLG